MDHQLENLGPDRFQQLVQALLVAEYTGITCFPIAQPDGGRDALQTLASDEQNDTKFAVYQVKFSRAPSEVIDAKEWILEKAIGEREKIKKLIERGARRYILATNVSGSGHLDAGSIDRAIKQLQIEVPIQTQIWWRDDINRRLDGNWDIKLRYSEVLSGHDFFRLLLESTAGQEHERRMNALRAFLAEQHSEDLEVKFKQVELNTKLLDLFIDLPFRLSLRTTKPDFGRFKIPFPFRTIYADAKFITITNNNEEQSVEGTATLLLSEFADQYLKQVVVEGAPGQGKSTLAQYLCQVHRIKLLDKDLDLAKLPDSDRHFSCRIPLKVDLRDLASWLSGIDPFVATTTPSAESRSLEAFLARLVRHNSGGLRFDVNDLLELSKLAPLLIVLDGLDEVVDIKQRSDVIAAVTKALPRLRENCPTLSIIVTSRPAAFANSPGFDPDQFVYIDLLSVKRSQIDQYAKKWMDVRTLTPKERAEFEQILKEKLDAPHLRELARNPMQLTILLSLILTQGPALPDKRTNLYDTYVDLFFSRESAKNVAVRRHIDLLKDLHRYIGWVLHSTAETNRKSSGGRISASDLKALLLEYLTRENHPTDVVEEIFGTMLARVVMIVPRIQGTYEFEVQPLREYFAGRYLYDTASYSPPGKEKKGTKPDRFDAIARNFYWLNVVRFFCGCFSKGEHLDLADRVRELIADPILGQSKHSVTLAAMLLSDWVFAQSPKAVKQITDALGTADGLRRLAAPGQRYLSNDVIHIPARSGGGDIFLTSFNALEAAQLQLDQRQRLAAIVTTHGTDEEINRRWWSSALAASDVVAWAQIGSLVGALQRVDRVNLLKRVEGTGIAKIMSSLSFAGRFDCILTSEANASLLWYQFLAAEPKSIRYSLGEAPFFLVPLLILPERYGAFLYYRRPEINRGLQVFSKIVQQGELPEQFRVKFVQECFEISKGIAESLNTPKLSVNVLEECRRLWGAKPAIFNAALRVVAHPGLPRTKPAHFSLTNSAEPMVSRLKAAKAKRKDPVWWRERVIEAKALPFSAKLFVLMACFNLASNSVLLQLSGDIRDELDAFDAEEWSTVVHLLSPQIDRISFSNRSSQSSLTAPPIKSYRLSYLMGLKSPRVIARKIFVKNLLKQHDRNLPIAEFRQICALDAALSSELDWPSAMTIIRETYALGAAYQIRRLYAPALPDDIANEVLMNPTLYPAAMWDIAESVASSKARKAIRPVGPIARAEKWFAN